MRLNNTIRDAFVRSVMQDVPSIDYDTEIRQLVLKDFITQLPKDVRTVYDKLPEYITQSGIYVDGIGRVYGPVTSNTKLTEKTKKKVEEMIALNKEQDKTHQTLRYNLRSVAYSVTTRKQLLLALPEFEKYMPTEKEAISKNLPALANVVSEFTKAGWPKKAKPVPTKHQASAQLSL